MRLRRLGSSDIPRRNIYSCDVPPQRIRDCVKTLIAGGVSILVGLGIATATVLTPKNEAMLQPTLWQTLPAPCPRLILTQGAGYAGTTTLQQKTVGVRSASKVIVLLEGTAFSAARPWKTRLPGKGFSTPIAKNLRKLFWPNLGLNCHSRRNPTLQMGVSDNHGISWEGWGGSAPSWGLPFFGIVVSDFRSTAFGGVKSYKLPYSLLHPFQFPVPRHLEHSLRPIKTISKTPIPSTETCPDSHLWLPSPAAGY